MIGHTLRYASHNFCSTCRQHHCSHTPGQLQVPIAAGLCCYEQEQKACPAGAPVSKGAATGMAPMLCFPVILAEVVQRSTSLWAYCVVQHSMLVQVVCIGGIQP